MKKNWIALLLAAMMVLSLLAGCGAGSTASSAEPAASAASAETEQAAGTETEPAEAPQAEEPAEAASAEEPAAEARGDPGTAARGTPEAVRGRFLPGSWLPMRVNSSRASGSRMKLTAQDWWLARTESVCGFGLRTRTGS